MWRSFFAQSNKTYYYTFAMNAQSLHFLSGCFWYIPLVWVRRQGNWAVSKHSVSDEYFFQKIQALSFLICNEFLQHCHYNYVLPVRHFGICCLLPVRTSTFLQMMSIRAHIKELRRLTVAWECNAILLANTLSQVALRILFMFSCSEMSDCMFAFL